MGQGALMGSVVDLIYRVEADDRRQSYIPVRMPAHARPSGWVPKVVPSGVDDAWLLRDRGAGDRTDEREERAR